MSKLDLLDSLKEYPDDATVWIGMDCTDGETEHETDALWTHLIPKKCFFGKHDRIMIYGDKPK